MVIKKKGKGKYELYSHKGKPLSKPGSLAAIKKRERQVQYFKHAGKRKK
jgi:hypothetical protein